MTRFWLISAIGIGLLFGIVFALYPETDLAIAELFFDARKARFPLATSQDWNLVRNIASWAPVIFLLPAVFALLRKLAYPRLPIAMAPSVILFLLGSFLLGPGLVVNALLKENWGRPRPNSVEQFAGAAHFEPWWRPSSECVRNCSFASGETAVAFWTVAPASLAPPQIRPVALGAAVLFGTSVGTLRVMFGRHFVTDVVFAGVITVILVILLYRFMLAPLRRSDARLERSLERFALTMHRRMGATLAEAGQGLARAGLALSGAGERLSRTAALAKEAD